MEIRQADIARDSRQHAPGQEISKPVSFPD